MAHGIIILKCKNGHHLPISFDSNECGCHHNGDPCIIISCRICLKEAVEAEMKGEKHNGSEQIYIPLSKQSLKELNEWKKKK